MTSYLLQIYKPTIGGVPKPSGRPHRMQGQAEAIACAVETSKAKGVAVVVVSASHRHGRHVVGSAKAGEFTASKTTHKESDMSKTPSPKTPIRTRGVWSYTEISAMDDAQIKTINTLQRKAHPTPEPEGFIPEDADKYHRLYGAFLLGARVYAPYPRECGLDRQQGIEARAKIRSLLMQTAGVPSVQPMTNEKVTKRAEALAATWTKEDKATEKAAKAEAKKAAKDKAA